MVEVCGSENTRPRLVFECLQFWERDSSRREISRKHIGSHYLLLESVWRCDTSRVYLQKLAEEVVKYDNEVSKQEASGRGVSRRLPDFVVACYCRAGEKRSVAMAVIVYHYLLAYGWSGEFQHLCDVYWRRLTCKGLCDDCKNYMSPEFAGRSTAIVQANRYFAQHAFWRQ